MSKTSTIAQEAEATAAEERRLEVTPFDRVSSWLIAALVTVGITVAVLVALWLSGRLSGRIFGPPRVDPSGDSFDLGRVGEGGGNGMAPGGSQLDTPSTEEGMGSNKTTSDASKDLSALGVAVADNAAKLDDPATVQGSLDTGYGQNGGNGHGQGLDIGPGKPGRPVPPRHWEVVFQKGNTLDLYARQLDFFGIELGVIMPGNRILYAFNLSKSKPDRKEVKNPFLNEKRYYLTWRDGALQQADEELLARAGIETEGHVIVKFLPPATELDLATKEKDFHGADPKDIRKTRFGVQPDGNGFKFYVMEQPLK